MNQLLKKMQYKNDNEIIILNIPDELRIDLQEIFTITKVLSASEKIKNEIRYNFILIFVKSETDVVKHLPLVKNSLMDDGVLWFAYPKKSSKKYSAYISRDVGWQSLNTLGFLPVRAVSISIDWSALRFRHIDYIKNLSRTHI